MRLFDVALNGRCFPPLKSDGTEWDIPYHMISVPIQDLSKKHRGVSGHCLVAFSVV